MHPSNSATHIRAHRNYQRIAQAIRFIRAHRADQPDLATVARQLHLSESHFQRLFTAWAGISPKRFLQFLTLEYAKTRMAHDRSLLELTLDAGLSSPGRLHDLFVTLEAMSPGEYQAGGAGSVIRYGVHATPLGAALLATTARGICNLLFLDPAEAIDAETVLRRQWPGAKLHGDPSVTQPLIDSIFQRGRIRRQVARIARQGQQFSDSGLAGVAANSTRRARQLPSARGEPGAPDRRSRRRRGAAPQSGGLSDSLSSRAAGIGRVGQLSLGVRTQGGVDRLGSISHRRGLIEAADRARDRYRRAVAAGRRSVRCFR